MTHRVRAAGERGQASVELALVLPVLILFLLGLVQTALVARDQVLLQDAARRSLAGVTVDVQRQGGVGDPVVVVARYHDRTDVPFVGGLFPDVDLTARATMRAER